MAETLKTATEAMREMDDRRRDERSVHSYMQHFIDRWAPFEKGEFVADLTLVLQAVHRDASRETHALLRRALQAMPPAPIFVEKSK